LMNQLLHKEINYRTIQGVEYPRLTLLPTDWNRK
jgi:hypothetical protein